MKKLLIPFLALLLIATAAYAALPTSNHTEFSIQTSKKYGKIGNIDLTGEINRNAASAVKEAFATFKKNKVTTVIFHLNSPGGDLGSGSKIVKEMIEAQLKDKVTVITFVGEDELCASMCTGVYSIGMVREAHKDSVWVFHSPFTKTDTDDDITQEDLDSAVSTARETLMAMYNVADPLFAQVVLKPYVYGTATEKELVLSGEQVTQLSKHYINILM